MNDPMSLGGLLRGLSGDSAEPAPAFEPGEQVVSLNYSTVYTVVVAEPDKLGAIIAMDDCSQYVLLKCSKIRKRPELLCVAQFVQQFTTGEATTRFLSAVEAVKPAEIEIGGLRYRLVQQEAEQ